MRLLLISVLCGTLIGCACPTVPQAIVKTCTSKGCFHRTAAASPTELKPTPVKRDRAIMNVASKNSTKTPSVATEEAKPASPQPSEGAEKNKIASPAPIVPESSASSPQPTENAKSTVGNNMSVAARGQPAKADPVLEKAKVTVASKMEDPTSAEFEDMSRAIRKDSFGQSVDTICGHVRGKKLSGTETERRTFLYLVREDIAFVDYGYPNSVAANAYRIVCTSGTVIEP